MFLRSKLNNYENNRDKISAKGFTNKRKHDRLRGLAFQKLKKGETKMRNIAKNIHNKLNGYKAYRQACLFCRALWRTLRMTAPAVTGAYMIYSYDDRLLIAIGVAGILYSFLIVVNSAYLAEASINKATSKRK